MKRIIYIVIVILFFYAMAHAQTNYQVYQEAYDQVNEFREENGLPPLMRSGVLELKAGHWLTEMHAKYPGLVHDRASKEAELLTDCKQPITCWIESKAHRQILLSRDYERIGIVLVEGDWCARLD